MLFYETNCLQLHTASSTEELSRRSPDPHLPRPPPHHPSFPSARCERPLHQLEHVKKKGTERTQACPSALIVHEYLKLGYEIAQLRLKTPSILS